MYTYIIGLFEVRSEINGYNGRVLCTYKVAINITHCYYILFELTYPLES